MRTILLQQFDEYLEKQDILNKLTEKQKLNEYGYSEIHAIYYIKTLEHPNATELSKHLKMTRGAISKITQKLQHKGLIESFLLPDNKQKVYFRLTEKGEEMFDAHEDRHQLWVERDMQFLEKFDQNYLQQISDFMNQYNEYLEMQISDLSKEGK